MPTRETVPAGEPCWIDLTTSDLARSRDFYTGLFGWEAEEPNPDFGGYVNFRRDGVRVAGCMAGQPGTPDTWSTYLATDDAATTVGQAVAAGATVVVEPMPVADLGTMAVITDPTGAVIGLWQAGTHPGFTTYAEPNAPGWFELHTRDYDRALGFYRDLLDATVNPVCDEPQLRYATLRHGDADIAGVIDAAGHLPEGMPSYWALYVAVEDTDAAVAKAVELGATVAEPAEDTPYGKLAALRDPTGTYVKLVGPNANMPMR